MDRILPLLTGAAIWLGIAGASGRLEAWDSPLYGTLGLPLLALAAAGFGALRRTRAWPCALWLMAGQFAALVLTSGVGGLLPLGAILFALMALPLMIPAALGAWLSRRFT